MNDNIKIALIVAGGVVLAVCLYVYFSPYQSCVRAVTSNNESRAYGELLCATQVNSN